MEENVFFRILIVGNKPAELPIIRDMIVFNFPSSVDIAVTFKDAMLQIDYHIYDLIFLDKEMKDGGEVQLQRYVEESFLNSNSQVILMAQAANLPSTGIDENNRNAYYIEKPVRQNDLLRLLHLQLRYKTREQEFNIAMQDEVKKRQQIENELERSRESFKNIVEKSDVGILITDNEGVIQFMNDASEQIFLRKKEELIGHQFGSIIASGGHTEITIIRRNGEVGIGEVNTVLTEWKGNPAKLVMINDITKHKKLQENLEVAIKKAQESDHLKTAFLANMSHEIRTPLNGILGFSQLMDNDNLATDQKRFYIDSIISCGNYLLNIINDIIDIAKIESGQLQISESKFDLMPVMRELHEMFKVNSKVVTKNLELVAEFPQLNTLFIKSDEVRLKQVLINLLNNASKFTDKGRITFGFSVKESNIEFFVKDTGKGIPKEDYENIFERFRQLDAPKNQLNEGNGLGLSISRAIVKLLGGQLWLESEVDVGTAFYFTVHAGTMENTVSQSLTQKGSKVSAGFKNKKILVVEDDENNYYFIEAIIKDPDTTIIWAKTGEEAVTMAQKENVDLILMDMKLPRKSGFDAVREIRQQKPDLPIIAQTAYAMGNDKEKVMAVGCNDYIAKPIKVNELLSKMHNFLN